MKKNSSRADFFETVNHDGVCFECDPSAMSFVGRYARELFRMFAKTKIPSVLHIRKTYDHAENFELPCTQQSDKTFQNPVKLLFLPAFALPHKDEIGSYLAFTSFDPEFISESEIAALKIPAHVFVPSGRHADFLRKIGMAGDKVSILAPTVDKQIYNPSAPWPDKLLRKSKDFIFLSILSPLRRHGVDLLLRAWVEEFKADEPVRLVLKLSHIPRIKKKLPYEISDLAVRLGALNKMFAPVSLLEGALTEDELAGLMAGSNVFVCPNRLNFAGCRKLEALSCGLPVIASSGIDEKFGYVVTRSPVKQKSNSLYIGSKCAEVLEPEIVSLRRCMRKAFQDAESLQKRRKECLIQAEKQGSWVERTSILANILVENYGLGF